MVKITDMRRLLEKLIAFDDIAKVLRVLTMGRDDGSAEITIQNGVAMLGFIPLGQIPPL